MALLAFYTKFKEAGE